MPPWDALLNAAGCCFSAALFQGCARLRFAPALPAGILPAAVWGRAERAARGGHHRSGRLGTVQGPWQGGCGTPIRTLSPPPADPSCTPEPLFPHAHACAFTMHPMPATPAHMCAHAMCHLCHPPEHSPPPPDIPATSPSHLPMVLSTCRSRCWCGSCAGRWPTCCLPRSATPGWTSARAGSSRQCSIYFLLTDSRLSSCGCYLALPPLAPSLLFLPPGTS